MKRVFAWILITALMVVPFAFSEEKIDPINVVRAILDVDSILLNHDSVSVNRIYYDADGNEMFSTYLFATLDQNGQIAIVSEDSEGNAEILSSQGCAGFDSWNMKLYIMGFVMNEYDENILQMKQNFFSDVRLNEKYVKDEIRDGVPVITTQAAYQGDFEGGCDTIEYVLDAETNEIREIYEYYEEADGTRILNSHSFVSMDAEYEADEAIRALFASENPRSVNVHMPDGEVNVFFAPPDVEVTIIYPEEYVLYEDEMKTRMYVGQEKDEYGFYPNETDLYLGVFG